MIAKFATRLTLLASLCAAGTAFAEYPARNIQAVVPWGAGGATDTVMRTLIPHVEQVLDGKFIITNRPGGTAAIGTNYVMQQRPDGYTVLLGAENPQLYPVLELAHFDYGDFETINIVGQNPAIIAVPADSPYQTMEALLAAVQAEPDTLRMGVSGPGSLPNSVHSLISAVQELKVRGVTYPGDGPGITALLGNHIDFMPLGLIAAQEMLKAGKLRALAVVASAELESLPGVPPITQAIPSMERYLPWGSFWGIWVRKEVPAEARERLSAAFAAAVAKEDFQKFLKGMGAQPLNLSGDEAGQYLDHWQSVTAWSMYEAGALDQSPQVLGIAKP
ncbi:MAG: tricarboxylate transport protein TctC [Pseudomonas sp.]|jgi:tripartite-type tricarboxylate transporter receptor subunit TctC|nr:tricarboxylate transport protein TctC [Pseudomonadales bacterium]MAK87985.1 tricarboxylate transport protein TctC [Pseudomonas sp.]|tara:strand:+ start:10536 stop:11534 length:999 start_codon:yes stop_codon:yes gene_type:complete